MSSMRACSAWRGFSPEYVCSDSWASRLGSCIITADPFTTIKEASTKRDYNFLTLARPGRCTWREDAGSGRVA